MFELTIASSIEHYKVTIGAEISNQASEFDVVIADRKLSSHLRQTHNVYLVNSSEQIKNLIEVEKICEFMRSVGVTRSSKLLAIGGGVIQDLATLAASIYMRGIAWSYAPTTLTGMADSCLGGKSSINVGSTKNLVGNVYPPKEVIIDAGFLVTLDSQSLDSGLAEGVKIAFARGSQEFQEFIGNPGSRSPKNDEDTISLINHTLNCKKWFIEIDEFDKKERQLLNFGHSFGHAFEAATEFTVQHGIAVAIGMLAAASHPASDKFDDVSRLVDYSKQLLSKHHELIASAISGLDWEVFKKSLASDKKNTKTDLVLILPDKEERLSRVSLPFENGAVDTACEALKSALAEIA